MIPELGHFALALAVHGGVAQAILPLWGAHRGDAAADAGGAGAGGRADARAGRGLCLPDLQLRGDDFSVLNVAENSHSLKPLLYKLTGTWGNHEGSTLLWCLILGICGGAVAVFGGGLPSSLRARVIGVLGGTACGFELFALLESNPFTRLWPPPIDGRDMNPLLQDPGLAFHPPILYIGYVGFAVPFAFAVAALLEGRIDAAWGRWVRPWALAAWCFLTGGIALGSWWAYYELGWGGYWFWDPVENASLLPWLTGTALLHSAIVVEKREALKVWTVLLAIGTFSLQPVRHLPGALGHPELGALLRQRPGARGVHPGPAGHRDRRLAAVVRAARPGLGASGLFAPISREGALVLNNILLCSIAAVVITGTTYPLFADLLFGAKLSVGAPFFNATVLPLAVPVFAAMSVGPVLSWKRAALRPALLRLWWAAGGGAGGRHGRLDRDAGASRAGLRRERVADRGRAGRHGRPGPAVPRAAGHQPCPARGLPRAVFGAALGHAGLGVTIAGIAGMSLASEAIVLVSPARRVRLAGYDWTLVELHDAAGPNYAARVATLRLTRDGRAVAT